jgi:hypothetical protein
MSRRRHILASKFFDTGVSVRRTYRFGFWTLQLMFVTKKILIWINIPVNEVSKSARPRFRAGDRAEAYIAFYATRTSPRFTIFTFYFAFTLVPGANTKINTAISATAFLEYGHNCWFISRSQYEPLEFSAPKVQTPSPDARSFGVLALPCVSSDGSFQCFHLFPKSLDGSNSCA